MLRLQTIINISILIPISYSKILEESTVNNIHSSLHACHFVVFIYNAGVFIQGYLDPQYASCICLIYYATHFLYGIHTVCTDAEFALPATLNQNSRPVAFIFILEAVRKWRHYLTGKHFSLITDQKSVAYMFDTKHQTEIKNDKIIRWRLELSTYDFDIVYRAREGNVPADTFSRVREMSLTLDNLLELHRSLCHPGVTRMAHFVKSCNLEDMKRITQLCKTCKECKPQYHHPRPSQLIKATQPFEQFNLDFKGPLPMNNQSKFMLTLIDEY